MKNLCSPNHNYWFTPGGNPTCDCQYWKQCCEMAEKFWKNHKPEVKSNLPKASLSGIIKSLFNIFNFFTMGLFEKIGLSRAERRRAEADLKKSTTPEERQYMEYVKNNAPKAQKKLQQFHEELAELGIMLVPALFPDVTNGILPIIELQAMPFDEYQQLKTAREAAKNHQASVEKRKEVEEQRDNAPAYPH